MNFLKKLKSLMIDINYKVSQRCKIECGWLLLQLFHRIRIMDAFETIRYIKEHGCSIARFGDGEFDLMMQGKDLRFQKASPEMAHGLEKVFSEINKNLLVCVPHSFCSLKGRTKESKLFWKSWAVHNDKQRTIVKRVRELSGKDSFFGDAQITRPYIAMKNEAHAQKIFPLLQSLWEGRKILIVEGYETRLGVGNDLFANTREIRRILAPNQNAFACYERILEAVCNSYETNDLIIIALGPTATILASDLSKKGMQALDIGHLDIEYEWYLRKVKNRIAIPGKYTNEVCSSAEQPQCEDPEYRKQIISHILQE